MPTIPLEWLVGPVAALALALWISNILWKAHQAADADVRKDRDEWKARWLAADKRVDALAETLRKAASK